MQVKKEGNKIPKIVYLGADIGGTNTRIYLYTTQNKKIKICAKYFFSTQELKNFKQAIQYILKDSRAKIKKGAIAIAGPISADRKTSRLTNANWKIKTKELGFKALLLNDFEALGYSINTLKEKDCKTIQKGKQELKGIIALIGAGTGLGKSILVYDKNKKIYVPLASEGGHGDLPIYDSDLLKYLKGFNKTIEYEDILSGSGLVTLYNFYQTIYEGQRGLKPEEILASKTTAAIKTKQEFVKYYARCAKNFVLDALSRGGLFIGGGIAQKNPSVFSKVFMDEFLNNKTFVKLLKQIPVKVIIKEDANVFGAIFANEQ